MRKILVITGTPGVGKTTIVRKLRSSLPGCSVYNSSELITKYGAYKGKDKFGTKIADLRKLRRIVLGLLKKERSGIILLDGHIFCEFSVPGAKVIVVRDHLDTIKARLLKRDYPVPKIRDNIVSEALNYCGFRSRENYGEVYEVLEGKSAAAQILRFIKTGSGLYKGEINMLPELRVVIKKNSKFAV